ncbi:MAG: FAD-binding protein, partial [Planctomycetes bacterium]|nr:FAD-binding protein [Planctomycetota bacterium]
RNAQGDIVEGLYAAGECACVSVHGANRLGNNSLLDLVVFGRRVGLHVAKNVDSIELGEMPNDAQNKIDQRIGSIKASTGTERSGVLHKELTEIMMQNVSIRRTEETLTEARTIVLDIRKRYQELGIDDKGDVFNTNLLEAIELGFMIDYSLVQIEGALARKESRGAHLRLDGPNEEQLPRDDENFLKHTYGTINNDSGEVDLEYGEVYLIQDHMEDGWDESLKERMKPKERKY